MRTIQRSWAALKSHMAKEQEDLGKAKDVKPAVDAEWFFQTGIGAADGWCC